MGYGYSVEFVDFDDWLNRIGMERIDKVLERQDREREAQRQKERNEAKNIHRDKSGRLNKGARLASKESCNEKGILLRYYSGMQVKEIVESMGCSKSTAYNVIRKHGKREKTETLEKFNYK